jgi:hypothetical protein
MVYLIGDNARAWHAISEYPHANFWSVNLSQISNRSTPQELSHSPFAIMALQNRQAFQTADAQKVMQDESDAEEEALVNDYQEQVHFDDGMDTLDRTNSYGGSGGQFQDMQGQLAAAATPLEYQATIDTKITSYDNYCNLFHYILNSEGPVDLEVPSVSFSTLIVLASSGYLASLPVSPKPQISSSADV